MSALPVEVEGEGCLLLLLLLIWLVSPLLVEIGAGVIVLWVLPPLPLLVDAGISVLWVLPPLFSVVEGATPSLSACVAWPEGALLDLLISKFAKQVVPGSGTDEVPCGRFVQYS